MTLKCSPVKKKISVSLPIDYYPGHEGAERSQVINDAFDSDIDENFHHLNNCQDDVVFEKEHVIEDVLLNPGPTDENIDISYVNI